MYSIVYFAKGREVSSSSTSWTRAMDKAGLIAVKSERPFPIVIKDDLGRIIYEIKG